MLNEALPVVTMKVGEEMVPTFSARLLHERLGVKEQFSDWVKRYTKKFVENQDFTGTPVRLDSGHVRMDYAFSLDMSKHVAMMSETENSHAIRQYFIEVEKEYSQGKAHAQVDDSAPERHRIKLDLYALKEAVEASAVLAALVFDVDSDEKRAAQLEFIQRTTGVPTDPFRALLHRNKERSEEFAVAESGSGVDSRPLSPSDIGRFYGISGAEVNRRLKEMGLQEEGRQQYTWIPTQKGMQYVASTPYGSIKWQRGILELFKAPTHTDTDDAEKEDMQVKLRRLMESKLN